MYREWPKALPDIQIVPVEYPGRGGRFSEPCATDARALAKQLAETISQSGVTNFSLFGHSLGALIAWELTLKLRRMGAILPQQLWLSARKAPHFRPEGEPRHSLPEGELVALLKEMGGTPDEFLDNPEFRQLLLPVVRADFQIHDQYELEPAEPLPCPITAIGGESDSQVSFAAISEWREYSGAEFEQHELPGGHFYLQNEGFLEWFRGELG